MRPTTTIIFESPRWRISSFFNGGAYALERRSAGKCKGFFVQDDDAAQFRAELDAWPEDTPIEHFCAEQFSIHTGTLTL